jgi:hypothetical protein
MNSTIYGGKSVVMGKIISAFLLEILLQGCFGSEYELQKFYRDPNSPAARMMGGIYAGVVDTFSSLEACLDTKADVERDDREIGYTNSRFVCVEV